MTVSVVVGFLDSSDMWVNWPHLQVMGLLGSEAVQSHIGVKLEDVFRQLAQLQLDNKHTRKYMNAC